MIVEYLLFIGSGFYVIASLIFFWLFLKTCRATDGIGLTFLKYLTIALSIGSFVIFIIRIWSEYGEMDFLTARAIATINPILLVVVGLYLNFLFHNTNKETQETDSKNIRIIKKDVKIVKKAVV